jgi:hypothetical protein
LFFKNRHISSALAELIRSTRAPTKDRLIGKIMGGNPAFRGTRVPVHMLAELVPSRVRTRYRRGSVSIVPDHSTSTVLIFLRSRLSMLADELIDAGQSLPDRTVSAASEVGSWTPQVRLRRLQIGPSPRRHDYTPE